MAEKLAPEKRHSFVHNGTFLISLSQFLQFCSVLIFIKWIRIKQTNPCACVILGQKVFEWDQTLDEVNIYIALPPNVHSKQFYCKIQSKHLELGIKGNPPYLNVTLIYLHLISFLIFSFFVILI